MYVNEKQTQYTESKRSNDLISDIYKFYEQQKQPKL